MGQDREEALGAERVAVWDQVAAPALVRAMAGESVAEFTESAVESRRRAQFLL